LIDAECATLLNKQEVDVEVGVTVGLFPTKALAELMANANVGDIVTIKLEGLVNTGKGNPFKSFTLEVA
jgi:hypothetical protein